MAELKAYKIVLSTESETVGRVVYSKKVYDQADVDKVIEDLEESHKMEVEQLLLKIVELKADYKEACGRLQTANLIKDEQLAATRHSKYKRYLAMAEICCEKKENCYNRALRKYSKDEADYLVRKSEFWQDREFRWLKIAEKFKEAK